MTKPCSVEGCTNPFLARTWCATHYARWKKHGEPGGAILKRKPANPDDTHKICTKCEIEKPLSDFYGESRNTNKRMSHCKNCFNASQRNGALKRKYGITASDYDAMVSSQEGRCAICQANDRKLVVDHCHIGGQTRALLCDQCNTGLGMFSDSSEKLQNAIAYLERHGI